MMFSRLGCRELSAFVDSLLPATADQKDRWVISGERSVELSVAMDGEIGKRARTPISQGRPGSSLAAAPMTFPSAWRWARGLVLGRLRLLCPPCHCAAPWVAGPEAVVCLGS